MMQNQMPGSVEGGSLLWRDERTPVSAYFNDVYFSVEGGLEEVRHVFLAGCGLPEAWYQHFTPEGSRVFVIGETGFGTGLNFLATCALWHQARVPEDAWLEYGSVELYPLCHADLRRALGCWPELYPFAEALLAHYPPPVPGFHRIVLPEYRVRLTLMIGDAATMLAQWSTGAGGGVDAWFLDGFAPARNPDMWRPAVFSALAHLSHHGTRLSSFTAARMVRDGLADVGFAVQRCRGFGRKRDMIQAVFQHRRVVPLRRLRRVAVVGGGVAGAAIAHICAMRGVQVTVYDRAPVPASGASGNPVGMVMPKLQLGTARAARFHRAAFRFARHIMGRAGPVGGVLQLAKDEAAALRMQRLLAEPFLADGEAKFLVTDAASDQAGIKLDHPGIWLPQAGWVRPAALVGQMLEQVAYCGGWHGTVGDIDALAEEYDHVVLATGMDVALHPLLRGLPLRPRKGQITMIAPAPGLAGLRCCITAGRYLAPLIDGAHVLGATFDPHDMTEPPVADTAADQSNLRQIKDFISGLVIGNIDILGHRVGVRATTPDHLPIVGRISDGISVLTGLGSSGVTTSWFCAEILATSLLGGAMPAEIDIVSALDYRRFLSVSSDSSVPPARSG